MSIQPNSFERPCRRAYQREHDKRKDEASDRDACGKREVEARKSQRIDQVCDHVHAPAADELRSSKGAEGPGERGGDASDNSGRGERECHGEKSTNWPGAQACRCALVVAV